jgi:tetratricopeptide (TPR) repeat protein
MAKKRVTRKQLLKEPDEFITTTGKLIGWARENSRSLGIGAVIFFTLIIGLSAYIYFNERRANTAQMMFSQALTKYQTELDQKGNVEALAAVSADFDLLISKYGNLPDGKLGRVYYGHICSAGLDYDKAIGHYLKALDDFGGASSLTNIILNGLATAYQQKGEYPQAIEQYRRILEGSTAILKDAALFNLGKLYGQIGEAEKSREAYQQLSADFPDSMYANIVREKIAG